MALSPGARLGPYTITAPLGAGGIMIEPMRVEGAAQADHFVVVLNWFEELKRLVPTR